MAIFVCFLEEIRELNATKKLLMVVFGKLLMEEDPNLFIFVYEETNVLVKDNKQDYVLREPTI